MPGSPAVDSFKRNTARRLRQNETNAEAKLWRALKRLEMSGSHFRRQVPIGKFVVDFACPAARLIIEVDGSQHADAGPLLRDAERTRWLSDQGYRVLRFWNNDVLQNISSAMESIYGELYGSSVAEPKPLKHKRRIRNGAPDHPTPARDARRPSPSRGG